MKLQITFTFDLEDHRPSESLPKRYPDITEKLLAFLDDRNVKATVFTVGKLAEKEPGLIKQICGAGHEIAHHSYDHTPVNRQTPEDFRDHTKKAKDILEDITGKAVTGYRAPVFSLTRSSLWAVDILKALGFEYSSSVLPAANPLHGLPGAPLNPFRWDNGMIEIPAPVGKIGPLTMPYLGGFYFRYLPFGIIKNQMAKAANDSVAWTYCHPYDFDGDEENWRIHGASTPVSLLLWFNRANTFNKMAQLFDHCDVLPPLRDQDFSSIEQVIAPSTLRQGTA